MGITITKTTRTSCVAAGPGPLALRARWGPRAVRPGGTTSCMTSGITSGTDIITININKINSSDNNLTNIIIIIY